MASLKSLLVCALHLASASAALAPRNATEVHLSNRAVPLAKAVAEGKESKKITDGPRFDKDKNPDGFINLGVAENYLMHGDIKAHVETNFTMDALLDLPYGPHDADPRLTRAMASFLNDEFRPAAPVKPEELVVGAGLTGIIHQVSWSICDGPQDGVLIPRPMYSGFVADVSKLANATLVGASFLQQGAAYSMDDAFDAGANYRAMERAYEEAAGKGVTVRGVIIANPHNPLGRYYSKEALKEIIRFCGERKIHLFSDEVYAKSIYTNEQYPNATTFTSVLELSLEELIDPQLVHVLYGMSKDFAASGLRLGVIQSRNTRLLDSITSTNAFSHPPFTTQQMWTSILEDKEYLKGYWTRYSERLTESFVTMRDWLDARGVSYYKGTNSGLFLWARLVDWPTDKSVEDYAKWRTEFLAKCLAAGVNVNDGDAFRPDNVEKGWFRLTHSVGAERLEVGLERLAKVLDAMPKP